MSTNTNAVLSLISSLGLGCVVMLVIWRKVYKTLPCFAAYVVFEAIACVLMIGIVLFASPETYFWAAWCAQAVSSLLGFWIIHEIFSKVLEEYEAVQGLAAMLFRWAFVMLLLVAAVAAASAPGGDFVRIVAGILVLQRTIRFIQVGLLLLILLFSSYLGLSWRHSMFGIALGFGLFIGIDLAATTIRQYAAEGVDIFNLTHVLGYWCALVIWVVYLRKEEAALPVVRSVPNSELEAWNRELARLLGR